MKERKLYFDYLRIIASMAVVMLHCAGEHWYGTTVLSYDWQVYNFFNAISRWGVPIFFMISGALFLSKEINIKDIFFKYVKRLFILFYLWSFIYAVYTIASGEKFTGFLYVLVFGYFHQWYLLTAAGLYIITPLLRLITKEKNSCVYFLIIIFVFSFLITTINDVLCAIGLPYAENFVDNISITNIPCYIGYYVLGYYLDKYEENNKKAIYILGLSGAFVTIVCTSLISIFNNITISVFYNERTPNVLFMAVAIYIYFKNSVLKRNKIIDKWSKYTLCIYLVHPLILNIIVRFGIDTTINNAFFATLINFVITYSISLILSMCLNRIPIINKYLT